MSCVLFGFSLILPIYSLQISKKRKCLVGDFLFIYFLKYLNGIGWRSPASCNGAVRVKITSGIHHFKVATHRKLLSPADHIEVMRTYPLHRGVNNWIGMRWAGVVRNFQSRNSSKHKIFALRVLCKPRRSLILSSSRCLQYLALCKMHVSKLLKRTASKGQLFVLTFRVTVQSLDNVHARSLMSNCFQNTGKHML